MEGINKISEINSFEKNEAALRLELQIKFDYLEKKINLVAAASKLNSLNAFNKSSRDDKLILVMLKHNNYKKRFERDWKVDLDIIDAKMWDINDTLESIIEIIEAVDCEKREDEQTYCRKGINYGREYIERGLRSIFGHGIYF